MATIARVEVQPNSPRGQVTAQETPLNAVPVIETPVSPQMDGQRWLMKVGEYVPAIATTILTAMTVMPIIR